MKSQSAILALQSPVPYSPSSSMINTRRCLNWRGGSRHGEQGVEGRVVKVEGQVSLSFDVRQRLAGGQVVDGDFVALSGGAGDGTASAGRRGGICTGTGGAAIAVAGYAG